MDDNAILVCMVNGCVGDMGMTIYEYSNKCKLNMEN